MVAWLLNAASVSAQLAVIVSPPKLTGQKAVVPLSLKNNLSQPVESARAVVFLLDEQGKVVCQGTRWVIGGGDTNRPPLAVGATNAFHFVLTADQPFSTTDLTSKVTFSRVVLKGGSLANPQTDVVVNAP